MQRAEKPKRVTIVGGNGLMGRFLADRLKHFGHEVRLFGRKDWERAETFFTDADLVIVGVPIGRTLEVIGQLAPFLKGRVPLADITSLKTPYVRAMLERHAGPVLGLHPMFGPGVKSFLAQRVIACEGRAREQFDWFLRLIAEDGGQVVWATPEEHDRMMTIVQAVRHFAGMALGYFMSQEGLDLGKSLEFASPVYRLELDIVGRLFAQDPGLYADIMLATPERREAIGRMARTCGELAEVVGRGDRAELIERFENTQRFFGPEAGRSLEESAYLIDVLSERLARRAGADSDSGEVNTPTVKARVPSDGIRMSCD